MFITRYLSELEWSHKTQSKPSSGGGPKLPLWTMPPTGLTNMNVDGVVAKTQEKGAVGAICKDDQGLFLGASAGILDPATLEALACREALELAGDIHVDKVMIALDCLTVVNKINSATYQGCYIIVLKDIIQRRALREANGDAHRIARLTATVDLGLHV
jgi:ribonuclease HI